MTKTQLDYSNLTIVRCSPAQVRQTRVNNFVQWGEPKGFTLESWITVQHGWFGNAWAQGDRFVTWALVPRTDPDTLNLLSHCETFRRNGVYLPPGEATPSDTYSYGISAVFCPLAHRGHNYAKALLSLLHYVMAPTDALPSFPKSWGQPPAIEGFQDARFSDLYSGIGNRYYATCRKGEGDESEAGWVHQKLTTRTWTVRPDHAAVVDEVNADWQWLYAEDVLSLGRELGQRMRQELSTLGDKSKTRLAILPEEDLLYYHVRRDQLQTIARGKPPSNRTYGLAVTSPQKGPPSFICYVFGDPDTLIITFVQHPFPFSAVLAAARREKCTKVELWGGNGQWDSDGGGAVLDENKNVVCLAQYNLGGDDRIDWLGLDRYTWC